MSEKRNLQKDLEICNKATPGPWDTFDTNPCDEAWAEAFPSDATFIAEARLGWPHAIDRALAAEARVAELEARSVLLPDASTEFGPFLACLASKQLTDVPCKIVVMPHAIVVQGESGVGFACYLPEHKVIVAGGDYRALAIAEDLLIDEAREIICYHIAHEYAHHIQNVTGKPFDEDKAGTFAEQAVAEWKKRGGE